MSRTVLVTGAGGFLGLALTRALVAAGHQVHGFSRGAYPELDALGVIQHRGDLADLEAVRAAVAGCEEVFHVAARPGAWGPHADYVAANLTGTENILRACLAQGTSRLIYTSTPSVIAHGEDLEGVDESHPYPATFKASYPKTKAAAERLVRAVDPQRLRAVSLRPHLVWGPGDTSLLPRIVARSRAGKLRRIERRGAAEKRIDTTYIDDAVQAHLCAAAALRQPDPVAAGRVYFISSGQPVGTWTMINRMLAAAGEPPVTRRVSPGLARLAGAACELVYRILRKAEEPPLTRWVADELATAHWFDIGAARRDLGYAPRVSLDEGMARLAEWWAAEQATR